MKNWNHDISTLRFESLTDFEKLLPKIRRILRFLFRPKQRLPSAIISLPLLYTSIHPFSEITYSQIHHLPTPQITPFKPNKKNLLLKPPDSPTPKNHQEQKSAVSMKSTNHVPRRIPNPASHQSEIAENLVNWDRIRREKCDVQQSSACLGGGVVGGCELCRGLWWCGCEMVRWRLLCLLIDGKDLSLDVVCVRWDIFLRSRWGDLGVDELSHFYLTSQNLVKSQHGGLFTWYMSSHKFLDI